jgi:hypothetical protein
MSITTLLWLAMFLLLLAVMGFAALWYFSFSTNAKLKRQIQEQEVRSNQLELGRKKAAGDESLALARNQQDASLVLVRQATNALSELFQDNGRLHERLDAFSTNAAGTEIALYPELVAQARRLYDHDVTELPANMLIIERLESARRMEQQLIEAGGTAYVPDAEVNTSAQGATGWAQSNLEKVKTVEASLAGLVRESKVKVFVGTRPANPPTLLAAIQKLNETESLTRQKTLVDQTDTAKSVAVDTVAKAEAERIIAEAKAKADTILRDARESAAAQERETKIKQAESHAKDTETDLTTKKIADEETHKKLLAKAADSDVKNKLVFFTTPGYAQFRTIEMDKKPVSLKVLESSGALTPTQTGMNILVIIGTTKLDKVRPRWPMAPGYSWPRNPESVETVREAQRLLIELGPVLVETGQLSP